MKERNVQKLIAGIFTVFLIGSFQSSFAAEEAATPDKEDFVARLKNLPISDLPDLSGEPLSLAIHMVNSGTALIIYNNRGASRVFFDGDLPSDLNTIRIVAVYAQVAGIVDDGEWNFYIKDSSGEHVEILDKDERNRIIDYVNDRPTDGKRTNVHMVHM